MIKKAEIEVTLPPEDHRNHQEPGECHRTHPPMEPTGGTYPAHTVTLDFRPPDHERVNISCFKSPHLWHFVTTASEWSANSCVKEESEAGRGDRGWTGSEWEDHGFG